MPEHKVQKRKKSKDYVNTFKYLYSTLIITFLLKFIINFSILSTLKVMQWLVGATTFH